jgi:hypothetical protein
MADKTGDPIDRQYRAFIESTYSPIPKDDQEKIIDNILTLVEMGHDKKQPLRSTLDFAAKMIFKPFDFHEIGIGLKNRKDGLYRYDILFGYRKTRCRSSSRSPPCRRGQDDSRKGSRLSDTYFFSTGIMTFAYRIVTPFTTSGFFE